MYQTNTCIMWMIKEAITLASRQCEKIVKEIADGNVRALEKLYSVAGKAMFFVAHNVLGDYQLAEDAIQESLIKIMNGASGLTNMKAAYTWIITVTRNCALDILRKRKNEFPTEETAFYEVGTDNISDASIDMKNALAKISEEDRNIVMMKAGFGFSHKEIAGVLQISETACQKRYQRALKELKEYLM